MEDTSDDNSGSLQNVNNELQRSRSPLETVAEETEGTQPILVTPETEWKSLPLLVEDSNRALLAPSLELALRYFFANCTKDVMEISRSDLMIILIYVIALESGLFPKGAQLPEFCRLEKHHGYSAFDKRFVKHFITRLPMEWMRNRAGLYKLELEMSHPKALRDNLCCAIVALCSGDLMIVNLIPTTDSMASFSTVVSISFHVPSVNAVRLPFNYQYVQGLALKLKNDLFVPFRNLIYYKYIPIVAPSLLGIPLEINNKLKSYLDRSSNKNLDTVFMKLATGVY